MFSKGVYVITAIYLRNGVDVGVNVTDIRGGARVREEAELLDWRMRWYGATKWRDV